MRERILIAGNVNDVSKQLADLVAMYGEKESIAWVGTLVRLDRAFGVLINGIKRIAR